MPPPWRSTARSPSDWPAGAGARRGDDGAGRAGEADRAAAGARRGGRARAGVGPDVGLLRDRPEPAGRASSLFLNAGDPPLDVFERLVLMIDECKVDCLEFAVPFPNSPTDGPGDPRVGRPRARPGVDREAMLAFIKDVRPELSHLEDRAAGRLALLDQGHADCDEFLERVKDSRRRRPARPRPAAADAPRVSTRRPRTSVCRSSRTCYSTSEPPVLQEAAEYGSAYIYLVSAYGRSGTVGPPDHSTLVPVLELLRERHRRPDRGRLRRQGPLPHRGPWGGRGRRGDRRQRLRRAALRRRRPRGATW